MKMKKLLLAAMTALITLPIFAQKDEMGVWTELELEKKINKRFDLSGGVDFRFNDNVGEVSRWRVTLGGSYKVLDWLKAGVTYQCISDLSRGEAKKDYDKDDGKFQGFNVDEAFRRDKHRFTFDLTGKWKVGRFTVALRERYQFTHSVATDIDRIRYREQVPGGYSGDSYDFGGYQWIEREFAEDHKGHKNNHQLRSRFEVEYDIPNCKLTPSVSYELKSSLQDAMATAGARVTAGVEWKLNKKQSVSAAYIFDDGHYEDAPNLHVLKIGYKFKF
jgi:hypothetical protein